MHNEEHIRNCRNTIKPPCPVTSIHAKDVLTVIIKTNTRKFTSEMTVRALANQEKR